MSHLYIVAYRWNLYINRSFLPFSFVSFFPYATTCLPACLPALIFCFVSLFCFSISPLVLVAILLYLYTNISVPALVLPKRATLYLDPFVTWAPLSITPDHNTRSKLRPRPDAPAVTVTSWTPTPGAFSFPTPTPGALSFPTDSIPRSPSQRNILQMVRYWRNSSTIRRSQFQD